MSQLDEAFDSLVDVLKVKSTRKERREALHNILLSTCIMRIMKEMPDPD